MKKYEETSLFFEIEPTQICWWNDIIGCEHSACYVCKFHSTYNVCEECAKIGCCLCAVFGQERTGKCYPQECG